jgi:cell division protein FtsL
VTPPAAAPAVRARTLAPPRPLVPAPRPRRVSGPARPARLRQPAAGALAAERGLVLGLLELLQRISRHRLLDRLIRGRAWIAIVVFALLGIVTLQLTLLKLNAGIGRSLERGALLQRENAALSIENSELAAGSRVEAAAEHLGMSLVPAGSLKFLGARPRTDPARAAAALSTPVSGTAVAEAASGGSEAAAKAAAETGAGTESASASEAAASEAASSSSSSSSSSSGEATSTTSSSQGEVSAESAPASQESTSAVAGPSSEATSSSAAESGPGGGTQAAPTG